MDLLVVVSAKLLFLLSGECAERLGNIAVGVLAAYHESDLARWVGGDGGIGVLDGWENFLAVLLELGYQWEMKPLVFGWEKSVVFCIWGNVESWRVSPKPAGAC